MKIKQGQAYIDDNNDTWYIEKAPTEDSVGVATFIGDDKRSDGIIKIHVGSDGTLFAINGRLVKMSDNVINMFSRKPQRDYDASDGESSIEKLFEEARTRNAENRKREQSERSKANKSVLRSYRIKNKD
jgi:hypothetical protein